MEKVLITGASGFVGRSLAEYLRSKGFHVLKLDICGRPDIMADISSIDSLERALEGVDVEVVVHLAAIANIPICIQRPYECIRVNGLGTLNVLELSVKKGVRRFIYLSSANVYGARPPLPVSEQAPLNPRTPYDYSKLVGEELVASYGEANGLPVVIFRSWKLFGEYDSATSAISRFIDSCLRNEEITLYNYGLDVTDPYHVDNLGYAVELAIRSDDAVGNVFNVGGGRKISIRELAEMVRRLTGSSSEIRYMPPRTEQEAEPMVSYPKLDKIYKVLGYRVLVSLEEGLKRVIEHRRRLMEEGGGQTQQPS